MPLRPPSLSTGHATGIRAARSPRAIRSNPSPRRVPARTARRAQTLYEWSRTYVRSVPITIVGASELEALREIPEQVTFAVLRIETVFPAWQIQIASTALLAMPYANEEFNTGPTLARIAMQGALLGNYGRESISPREYWQFRAKALREPFERMVVPSSDELLQSQINMLACIGNFLVLAESDSFVRGVIERSPRLQEIVWAFPDAAPGRLVPFCFRAVPWPVYALVLEAQGAVDMLLTNRWNRSGYELEPRERLMRSILEPYAPDSIKGRIALPNGSSVPEDYFWDALAPVADDVIRVTEQMASAGPARWNDNVLHGYVDSALENLS